MGAARQPARGASRRGGRACRGVDGSRQMQHARPRQERRAARRRPHGRSTPGSVRRRARSTPCSGKPNGRSASSDRPPEHAERRARATPNVGLSRGGRARQSPRALLRARRRRARGTRAAPRPSRTAPSAPPCRRPSSRIDGHVGRQRRQREQRIDARAEVEDRAAHARADEAVGARTPRDQHVDVVGASSGQPLRLPDTRPRARSRQRSASAVAGTSTSTRTVKPADRRGRRGRRPRTRARRPRS